MNPFLGQLLAAGFDFAPFGWAIAAGQLLPISSNTALFSLLGTNFGGDGKSTFGLPDLKGNIPVSSGQGPGLSDYSLGQTAGSSNITLLASEMPLHFHTAQTLTGRITGQVTSPANAILAATSGAFIYSTNGALNQSLAPGMLQMTGGSAAHNNMMPYQGINWIIAMQGVFPQRS